MKYDFTTVHSRKGVGADKWNNMYAANPDVPEGIVPFSVADMEFANPPQLAEGVYRYMQNTILGYTHAWDSYYDAVISWMKRRHDWDIKREWIVEYPGIVPALFQLVRLFTQPGEGVILFTPVYYPFYTAVEKGNRTLVECPLRPNGNRYEIDFDDFEQKARDPKNTMLILCSPHNPVGRVWTREELERVGRICIDNNVLIVSDEIHNDLIMPGYQHTVFASISEEFAQHSIVCTAPTKTFNMAGLMTSNIIIPNPELKQRALTYREDQAVYFCNVAGYEACRVVYNECEDWLEELLQVLDTNRQLIKDYMAERFPQIKVFELEGTYLQWLDCRGLDLTYKELEEFMQKDALIYTDEGYVFGECGEGFERINLACPTQVLQDALDRMYDAWMRRQNNH